MDTPGQNGTASNGKASIYAGLTASLDHLGYVIGGAERDRTADLLVAKMLLYQFPTT